MKRLLHHPPTSFRFNFFSSPDKNSPLQGRDSRGSSTYAEKPSQEIQPVQIEPRKVVNQRLRIVKGQGQRLELVIGDNVRPLGVGRSAEHLEDEVHFVLCRGAGKHWPTGGHLEKDAAYAPHVDVGRVISRS